MRLAEPGHLVDINRIRSLDFVRSDFSGVTIGATARHRTVELDPGAAAVQPLLAQGLRFVAHPTIRNRGTSVGSLAHADPSGELTAILSLVDGHITAISSRGTRRIRAADFFVGPLESSLAPDELAIEAFFPALPMLTGTAFNEIARRHGDYALCGVAAMVTLDAGGAMTTVRAGYVSVGETPLVLDVTGAALDGDEALSAFATGAVSPVSDIHATAEYRRRLAGVLTVRAVAVAHRQARAMTEVA
jgi:carbon-monoxide dehydrogenase medium subunit